MLNRRVRRTQVIEALRVLPGVGADHRGRQGVPTMGVTVSQPLAAEHMPSTLWRVGFRLETDRLVIRSFEAADSERWLELTNDPEVSRYTPPGPDLTMADFEQVLLRRHSSERERGHAMRARPNRHSRATAPRCRVGARRAGCAGGAARMTATSGPCS